MDARRGDALVAGLTGLAGTGTALVVAGVATIFAHLSSVVGMAAPICGATGPLTVARVVLSETPHCWGCPVTLVGGLFVAGAAAASLLRPSRDRRTMSPPGAVAFGAR